MRKQAAGGLLCLMLMLSAGAAFGDEVIAEGNGAGITELYLFTEIPKVSVASKRLESVEQAAGVVTVITEKEIAQFGGNNLLDLIERIAGVYTLGSYMFPNNKVSIRGDFLTHTDDSVLILLNGRPLRESISGGWNYPVYGAFPLEAISSIEVIRGPGSVLYGSNAFVGVINIITKSGDEDFSGKVTAGGGSFGTKLGSLSAGGKTGDLKVYGAFKYFNREGWTYKAVDEYGRSDEANRQEIYQGAFVNLQYQDFTLNCFQTKSRQWHIGSSPDWRQSGTLDPERFFADLGYKLNFDEAWYATVNVTFNYLNSVFNPDPQPLSKASDILGEVTLFGTISKELDFIAGAVVDDRFCSENGDLIDMPGRPWDGLRTNYIDPFDQKNYTAYLEATYRPLDILKLIAGLQYNYPYNGNADVVPRAGAVINFMNDFGAKILYGQAFRSPWPIETNIHHYVLGGNSELKSEKIDTSSAQLFYKTAQLSFALTGFYSYYTDFITRKATGLTQPQFTYINKGSMVSKGAELESQAQILSNLTVSGSYSYQTNTNSDGQVNVTEIPNHMIKVGLAYNPLEGINLGLFNSYIGQANPVKNINPAVREVNPDAEPYNWMTAKVAFDLSKLLDFWKEHPVGIEFYGENLLDESVYYPENGRRRINTLPGRSGRAIYADVTVQY
ncbi:MAG: TonB-dependent receptor [candidate division FCPU426 bacterium]